MGGDGAVLDFDTQYYYASTKCKFPCFTHDILFTPDIDVVSIPPGMESVDYAATISLSVQTVFEVHYPKLQRIATVLELWKL